jgi:hypothetical protein
MSNNNKIKNIKIPNSEVVKRIGNDCYRIKINIQLRNLGVKDILLYPETFDIISDDFSVSVPHRYEVEEIVNGTSEQLLDPIHDLSAYIVRKIVNYLYSIWEEIDSVLVYLKWKFEKQ